MPLKFVKWITRDMVQAEPDARFVFGDNAARVGLGGQAKAMRGEPNAIGVATKRHCFGGSDQFFSDDQVDALAIVDKDIDLVVTALSQGRTVYVPLDGLGTGLSELPSRAPALHKHIVGRFREMASDDFPWSE